MQLNQWSQSSEQEFECQDKRKNKFRYFIEQFSRTYSTTRSSCQAALNKHVNFLKQTMQLMPLELLLFSQLFGATPLKYVKDNKPKAKPRLKYSPKLQYWCLFFITTLVGMSFFSLYSEFSDNWSRTGSMSYARAIAIVLDIVPLTLMAVVVAACASRRYTELLEMCQVVERLDNTLQLKINPQKTRLKVLMVSVFTTVVLVLTLAKRSERVPRYWAYFLYRITYLVQAALYLQFSFVCNTLATRFTVINTKFRQEIIRPKVQVMDINLCLPYVDISSDSFSVLSGLTSVQQLRVLMVSYSDLCEAVQRANHFYGPQLLTAVFSAFVHNIATLYFFIHMLLTPNTDLSHKLVQALWVLTHASYLVLLILPASALCHAADQTGPNICLLMSKSYNNTATRDQLKTFLMQLHHYKVGFSAIGFFYINNQILTTIFGSVTTFLAILIQFHNAEPSPAPETTVSVPTTTTVM